MLNNMPNKCKLKIKLNILNALKNKNLNKVNINQMHNALHQF